MFVGIETRTNNDGEHSDIFYMNRPTFSDLLILTIIQREEQSLVQGIKIVHRSTKLFHNDTYVEVPCDEFMFRVLSVCQLSGGRRQVFVFAFILFILVMLADVITRHCDRNIAYSRYLHP